MPHERPDELVRLPDGRAVQLWQGGDPRGVPVLFLHGTPDCEPLGVPGSHGCVRLRNRDLLKLFPRVPAYCPVRIDEAPCPQWAGAPLS